MIEYMVPIVVWGSARQTHINCTQITQDNSLKIILCKPRLYSINLYTLWSQNIIYGKTIIYYKKKTLYYVTRKN